MNMCYLFIPAHRLQGIPQKETSVIYLNTCRMKIKISENLPSHSRKILHYTTRDLSLYVLCCAKVPRPLSSWIIQLLAPVFTVYAAVVSAGAGPGHRATVPPGRSDAKCFPQYPDTMGFATKLDCCCCWWGGYFAKTSTLKIRYCKFLSWWCVATATMM